jgi:hypothetical protein
MDMAIRYGGRAGGAFLAYKFLGSKVGGGTLGLAAVVALGWLAGGFVADMAAAKVTA